MRIAPKGWTFQLPLIEMGKYQFAAYTGFTPIFIFSSRIWLI